MFSKNRHAHRRIGADPNHFGTWGKPQNGVLLSGNKVEVKIYNRNKRQAVVVVVGIKATLPNSWRRIKGHNGDGEGVLSESHWARAKTPEGNLCHFLHRHGRRPAVPPNCQEGAVKAAWRKRHFYGSGRFSFQEVQCCQCCSHSGGNRWCIHWRLDLMPLWTLPPEAITSPCLKGGLALLIDFFSLCV